MTIKEQTGCCMAKDFDILIEKLNAFIRKYYLNKLIRGIIVSLTGILLLFLFVDFVEYFAWMGKVYRQIIFYSFLLIILVVVVTQIAIPLLKLIKIGKTLTYEEAAKIVGKHFPEVDDKLLNVLQLKFKEKTFSKEELELLNASVSQKSMVLKPVPFTSAIDLKSNLKYLKYLLPLVLMIVAFLIVYPAFIVEPSKRIINYEKHFTKPLPYSIKLINNKIQVLQHDDFTVKVKVTGDETPSEIYVKADGVKYRMYPEKHDIYEYTFKDVNRDITFAIVTENFRSENYLLKVIPKPVIYSFDVILNYPRYLNKEKDKISGMGDMVLPEGTSIEWRIYTKDVSKVFFIVNDSTVPTKKVNENTFVKKLIARKNIRYGMFAVNEQTQGKDTLFYSVQVIKDEYPKIKVEKYTNPDFIGYVQFNGKISDDYGFHSLKFYYKKTENQKDWNVETLKIDKQSTEQFFNYSMQLIEMVGEENNSLQYYFEVKDNDAIHYFKPARTAIDIISVPGKAEIEKMKDSTSVKLKKSLEKKLKELDILNRSVEKTKRELFEKKKLNWSDKQKIKKLLQKEKEIQEKLDEIKKLNEEIRNLEKSLEEKMDPVLKEKLDELRKMFEEMKDENFEKELEKLKEELDKMDKDELDKFLEKIKKENQNLKDNLEQNLELYKQMEVEKKVDEIVNKLEKLAEKQEKLAEQTRNNQISKDSAIKKQEDIKKEFESIEKQMDEMEKLDKELKEPFNIKKDEKSVDSTKQDMQQAEDKLNKNKRKKASEKQKQAAGKMKKMAENMESMMSMAMMQRTGEDIEMIRRLLDNIIGLSFKQEDLIKFISGLSTKDPQFVSSTEEIKNIKDEFKILRDSLRAIGERQVAIKSYIIKETQKIESRLSSSINAMTNRKKGSSLSHQQYAMTNMNNLALMLDESLEQMKNSLSMMSSKGKGQKSCPNPGQGKGKGKGKGMSLENIMKQQQELSRGLQKGNKKGNKNNNSKNGNGQGQLGNSEQLAKMAAMQYEIRLQLQKYLEDLKGQGIDDGGLNQAVEEMKKNENDIINKNITRETIKRQKDIEVRLLKAKNAKIQREKEKKRESREGINRKNRKIPEQKFMHKKDFEKDIILTKPVELKYYYNKIYKKYMYRIDLKH